MNELDVGWIGNSENDDAARGALEAYESIRFAVDLADDDRFRLGPLGI